MDGLLTLSNDLAAAVERAGQVVFGVNARTRLGSTGVHWRSGLIVTANHTVRVDEDITVTRPDGRAIAATLAGRDPAIDIAVLKVDAPDVAVADLGESNAVRVGHLVLAVGRGPCASGGVVSAIGEGRGPRSAGGALFSLDLTLYPGFSGGPLVNAQGQVIGVNSSGMSRQLQLAIPSAAVTRVVDELVRRGRLARPYLGVGTQPVSLPEALRQRFNLEQPTAVIVVAVQPSSPAASAGLLMGDIIVSLGGTSITDPGDLASVLRPDHVGEEMTVSVLRGGEPRDIRITVGERPRRS
ncbi:MAG: LuxR family transcriptional regulator [Candidatus Rokuibacteriota bacterium]|nr:MAG: LuxR family transcriptional regulator [Candidatus Rokubacteria bacterium]